MYTGPDFFPIDLHCERDVCKSADTFFWVSQPLWNDWFHYQNLIHFRLDELHNWLVLSSFKLARGLNQKLAVSAVSSEHAPWVYAAHRAFIRHSATFMGIKRSLPPLLYPVLLILWVRPLTAKKKTHLWSSRRAMAVVALPPFKWMGGLAFHCTGRFCLNTA